MEPNILLEAGTNELEVLVFKLGTTPFGINVAKVREIVAPCETIAIPFAPDAIEGSFKLRDEILTLINLGRHFDMEGEQIRQGQGVIIVLEFNDTHCGLFVDEVSRIYRLRWDEIQSPSRYLVNLQAPVTGVAHIDSQTVLMADFETVVSDILGVPCVNVTVETGVDLGSQEKARIMVVDDSYLVRKVLVQRFNEAGLTNLIVCDDGQDAWNRIEAQRDQENGPCDLVLSDIEMPGMDGLHLTSKIKNDPQLKHIPVVLFSSLITPDNVKKCQAVGADAQMKKSDGDEMILTVTSLIKKSHSCISKDEQR